MNSWKSKQKGNKKKINVGKSQQRRNCEFLHNTIEAKRITFEKSKNMRVK